MADFFYPLFDTVVLGTAADTLHTLFQVSEGADSVHTAQFTNMRGAGILPQEERFVIRKIHAIVQGEVAEADLPLLFQGNYLEVVINNDTLFRAPLHLCSSHNAYGGAVNQAAAANNLAIGMMGMGLDINPTISLQGGRNFKVRVYQESALSVTENMLIVLEGVLTLP